MSEADRSAPGWDAIDAVLVAQYGDQEPRQVGSTLAYDADGHWHYVHLGLSELFDPVPGADPAVSGWGFELTMRVPRGGDEPPAWPFRLLEEVARYVADERAVLAPGHRLDVRHPVTGSADTGLTVLAFAVDPVLGEVDTPNGRVVFLQAVGVTAAERDRMVAGSTAEVLDALGDRLLRTDPSRA